MHDSYVNPLCLRYAGKEMQFIFSDDNRYSTWRKLWIALAEGEKELGLDITDEQISEMKEHISDIDYELEKRYENELRHDVMAHIRTYGDVCPKAKPIIHLGATSCYVCDNADVVIQREAILAIRKKLVSTINSLNNFALKNKDVPTLAFTHFQAAQPTTVGKRATLWAQDLVMDLENLDYVLNNLRLLGCKGATGTCASFLGIFKDADKVLQLEKLICAKLGFDKCFAVSGQTYTRKQDYFILSMLSGIAQSASKFANDVRLLAHLKELDEPFGSKQVGSSAMAYKRNPMRSERICSLARYVIVDALNPALTTSAQWLERTLDDSANRRISIPEAFLAIDGILNLYMNIVDGATLFPAVMNSHLDEELPYIATENILMYCVKNKGKDRQELHEAIRELSLSVAKRIKLEGGKNDLLDRIACDERFGITKDELLKIVNVKDFVGLAPMQTESFCKTVLQPIITENKDCLDVEYDIRV
ncbi:MAG: adenylosuccinate lyase [Christensenellaceae bacterium]